MVHFNPWKSFSLNKPMYRIGDDIEFLVLNAAATSSIIVQIQSDTEIGWEDVTLTETTPGAIYREYFVPSYRTQIPCDGEVLAVNNGD